MKRHWTADEITYLKENWGKLSVGTIAKALDRTEDAILLKKTRLGLQCFLESGDYITFNTLLKELGISSGGYKTISWMQNRQFPVHTKRVHNNSFKIVYIDEFWLWAEKNQEMIDFSKVEENIFGEEPAWVKTKRAHDFEQRQRYISTPWTHIEDEKLKRYLKKFQYSYHDLSLMLHRTTGAIQTRICYLGLKERPIKADNHIKWTDEEWDKVLSMVLAGYKYELIAEKIDRSSKAIRGKMGREFCTENLDKVREILSTQGNVQSSCTHDKAS